MISFLLFLSGVLLGAIFVEITYRLLRKTYIFIYILFLPIKLVSTALILYSFFVMKGFYGLLSGIVAFFLGFFTMILLRGFKYHGGFKST